MKPILPILSSPLAAFAGWWRAAVRRTPAAGRPGPGGAVAHQAVVRRLFDSSPLGILVFAGAGGDCLEANAAAGRILGLAPAELAGRGLAGRDDACSRLLCGTVAAAPADGSACEGEAEIAAGEGHGRWLAYHASRVEGGLVLLMIEDITLRKRLEAQQAQLQEDLERRVAERTMALAQANAELAGSSRRLRIFKAVMDQAPMAIVVTDRGMGITYANPAFTGLTGYSLGEALGRDPWFIAETGDGAVSGQRRLVAEGRSWQGEVACRAKDGRAYWADALVAPMAGPDGGLAGLICFHRDITAAKRSQAEARRREEALIQSDRLAALGTLVAGVGHEINNPANFISLNAPLLRDFWLSAEPVLAEHAERDPGFRLNNLPWPRAQAVVPRLFSGIEEGIDRIRHIVGDLRDFARPDASGAQEVDINRVVTAAVAITNHAIGKATARFACHLASGLPTVQGSFQKLEQVVVNLVLNACQALPDPDRAVTVSTGAEDGGRRVLLRVEDQGAGIPAEHLAHLGEPFFTTKRDRGGTGLGLSVSRRIVEDHGGELRFDSAPGRGTAVTVLLPCTPPPPG